MPLLLHKCRAVYEWLYLILVFCSIALPSAKIYFLNIKIILTLSLVLFALAYAWLIKVKRQDSVSELANQAWPSLTYHLRTVLSVFVILVIWSLVSLFYGYSPYAELRAMLAPLVLIAAYHPKIISPVRLITTIVSAAFLFSALKLIVVFGMYFQVWTFEEVWNFLRTIFHAEFVSSPSCVPSLYAMVIVNDLVLSFLPLMLLKSKFSRPWGIVIVLIAGLAVFTSYSRYLMAAYIVNLGIVFLNMEWRKNLAVTTIAEVLLFGGATVGWGGCFMERFAIAETVKSETVKSETVKVSANEYSDSFRKTQIGYLMQQVAKFPWFGSGVGSYPRDYIRLSAYPFSYELQLLSLLYKFGIIGFGILSALVFRYVYLIVKNNIWAWGSVVTLFFSGVFNPYYESSAFGAVFVLIMISWVCKECRPSYQSVGVK